MKSPGPLFWPLNGTGLPSYGPRPGKVGLIACWAASAEPDIVSLKKLNDDSSAFRGKVVQVATQVSGTATEKPKFVWLTVKGKALKVEGSRVNEEGINFVVPKKDSDRRGGTAAPNPCSSARQPVASKSPLEEIICCFQITSSRRSTRLT